MKYISLCTAILFFSLRLNAQSVVDIPAGESVEFNYSDFNVTDVQLKNKGTKNIEVLVFDKGTDKRLRSFGLGPLGKETVMVESSAKLVLKNRNDTPESVKIQSTKSGKSITVNSNKIVNFKLQNSSDQSIPLIIPTVMNPNLSPNSMSGVSLKMGQEILFKVRGRKYVLLTVDESIQKDDVLDVAKLLPIRKKELGLVK